MGTLERPSGLPALLASHAAEQRLFEIRSVSDLQLLTTTLYSLYVTNTERLSTAYLSRCALQIAYFRKLEYQKNGRRFNDDQVSDLHRVRLTPDLLERTRGSALSRNFLCRALLFLLRSY